MEPLARLVLDGVRIGFEGFDLLLQFGVFLLEFADVFADRRVFGAPLFVDVHAVFAEDGVIAKEESGNDHRGGGNAPPHAKERLPDAYRNIRVLLLASQ